jgi:hypothetical protein
MEVFQVRPARWEFHQHTTRGLADPRGDLDQSRAPRTRLALAEWVVLAAAVVPAATLAGPIEARGQVHPHEFWRGGNRSPVLGRGPRRRTRASKTGQVGDGRIFISDLADAVRIRSGESGEDAV